MLNDQGVQKLKPVEFKHTDSYNVDVYYVHSI